MWLGNTKRADKSMVESSRPFRWNRPLPTVSCHLFPRRETLYPYPPCSLPMSSPYLRCVSCPVRAFPSGFPAALAERWPNSQSIRLVGPRVYPTLAFMLASSLAPGFPCLLIFWPVSCVFAALTHFSLGLIFLIDSYMLFITSPWSYMSIVN